MLLCCESLVGQVAHLIGWRHISIGFDELTLFISPNNFVTIFYYYFFYLFIMVIIRFICVVVAGVTWFIFILVLLLDLF